MSARADGASQKAALPKRFYKRAEALAVEDGFSIALDGRHARTPARRPLVLPNGALGAAIAAEWEAQGETIDPATMPLTRIANVAIDGVADDREAIAAEIVKYAGSDLVCYRAEHPERLVARQSAHWDPVIAFARDRLGVRFALAEGVMFVGQSEEALEAVALAVGSEDVFTLTALNVLTTLTGSALIALALRRGALDVEAAWAAANVDDDWNEELWGYDQEAATRKANREREMRAAARIMALARR